MTIRSAVIATAAALAAASAAAPHRLGAQLAPVTVRTAPQVVSYRIASGGASQVATQVAVPLFVVVPIGSRVSVDVGTAYATSSLDDGATTQTISGLTDTQVRANIALPGDLVVVTLGANLPTGTATLPTEQLVLGAILGTDLLGFPVPIYGTGAAFTGGVALGRQVGSWTVGGGVSVRAAQPYTPFRGDPAVSSLRFSPGSEIRGSLNAEWVAPESRVALGATYATYAGEALSDTFTVATGDRLIVQAAYVGSLGDGKPQLFASLWNLSFGSGRFAGNAYAAQNVTDVQAALGFGLGRVTLEPNIEGRLWAGGAERNGFIGYLGLRTRIPVGGVTLFPGASYGAGRFTQSFGGASLDGTFTGFRATIGASWSPR